jgi:hypothetical protein
MSPFVRRMIFLLVGFALLPAAALAAPPRPGMDIAMTPDRGALQRVFDDHGWRKRTYACCHGRKAGPNAGILRSGVPPRLGDGGSGSGAYGSHDWRGAYGGDDPVYGQERLVPSRTYQRDSLGGGYYGGSSLLDDGH